MPKTLALDNYASPCDLQIDSLLLHGFLSTHGVANFLNVPYAAFPARFRTAQLVDPGELTGERDASHYGPRCPQPDDPVHGLMAHLFEQLPMEQYTEEQSCLDVNIYVPPEALEQPTEKLSVFAWIHGGSFNCGDNTTEFDGNHLVARSIRLGRPLVVVTINYRLNVLGFLTSAALDAEARAAGETPVHNQGLHDQQLALVWIRRHIGCFGGDGTRVTVGGESAGALSIRYLLHIQTDEPLFAGALVCSAPRPVLRPCADGQALFDRLVAALGVRADAPDHTKLAMLRRCTAEDLVARATPLLGVSFPYEDSRLGPEDWSRLPTWCRRVAVGHTADEAALFWAAAHLQDASRPLTDAEALSRVQRAVCAGDAAMAAAVWGLDVPALREATTPQHRLIRLATYAMMVGPVETWAAAASSTAAVYQYAIDTVDPFPGRTLDGRSPGPLQGFAWHSFGNALVFYQPACQGDAELAATAERVSESVIGLVHGEETPGGWQPRRLGSKMRWNGTRSGMVPAAGYDVVAAGIAALGQPAWCAAYEAFCSDFINILGLIGA